jgi:hypothetical protein
MKKDLMMLTSIALALSGESQDVVFRSEPPPPKEPVIPKGCKKYVFKESFGTLEVIAINEKSAMKKYNKWCKLTTEKTEP